MLYFPEIFCIVASLVIAIILLVGTYNRWNLLVNPSTKRWWYNPPSAVNRFFGTWSLVIANYSIGFMFFALALLSFNGGLRIIYYKTLFDDSKYQKGNGWNVYTGVSSEIADVCVDTPKEKVLQLKRSGDVCTVRIVDEFPCDRELNRPYLSVGVDNKYTLVLSSKYPLLFATSCDCTKDMTIKLKNRLSKGATLYVLNDGEVIGHFIVP